MSTQVVESVKSFLREAPNPSISDRSKSVSRGLSCTSISFLLGGAMLRIICFVFSFNDGGDALSRAATTADWLQHPTWRLDAFGPYLPLHFWLMAIPGSLLGNVELGSRLLSLLLGIASLYLFWLCSHELFGQTAANYSLAVFALYSLHVGYSTTSSSEAATLFFLLGALFFFFCFRRDGSYWLLIMSGLTMTCASAIRYESWVITLAMGLALLWPISEIIGSSYWRLGRLFPTLVFGMSAGSWPLLFMTYCWIKFRDPLHYLSMQKTWTGEIGAFTKNGILYILAFHPGVMLITLSPFAIAAILYAIWVGRRQMSPDYLIIMLVLAALQFYDLISGGTWPSARYSMILGTLLALCAGYGVKMFLSHLPHPARTAVSVVFIAGLALNLGVISILSEAHWRYTDKFRSISPLVPFPLHVEQIASYLKPRVDTSTSVIIDNYNCESNIIARAVGFPLSGNASRTFLASSRLHTYSCEVPPAFSSSEIRAEIADLHDFLKARRPKFVIYSDSGTLRPYLPLTAESYRSAIDGATFRRVYTGEIYRVYEVSY